MNYSELLDEIKSIRTRISFYKDKSIRLRTNVIDLSKDISELLEKQKLIERSKQRYLKYVDTVYIQSLKEMEGFVNYVLSYVFYDEEYSLETEISDKYSNKSITFYLIDNKRNLRIPLRKGCGKGVKSVVSFILLTYYLLRQHCQYIFLDENFVNISSEYTERFFDFVRTLCHDYKMCIVLITHDPRFENFADCIYEVNQGRISKVKDNE